MKIEKCNNFYMDIEKHLKCAEKLEKVNGSKTNRSHGK